MDFLSTVPVLRFFTKTGVGEVSKLCDFFRCWWPPPRCREGGKSGNFFWSTFWLKWFFYFIVFVWLPWNSRPALQISWPVPSPGLSCPGQWPPRMCWTHPLDWWYNHQVDNALCLKVEWEKFFGFRVNSAIIDVPWTRKRKIDLLWIDADFPAIVDMLWTKRTKILDYTDLICYEWMRITLPSLSCCDRRGIILSSLMCCV